MYLHSELVQFLTLYADINFVNLLLGGSTGCWSHFKTEAVLTCYLITLTFTFRPLNGVIGHGLPSCQFPACYTLPLLTQGRAQERQTDRQTDRQRPSTLNVPTHGAGITNYNASELVGLLYAVQKNPSATVLLHVSSMWYIFILLWHDIAYFCWKCC